MDGERKKERGEGRDFEWVTETPHVPSHPKHASPALPLITWKVRLLLHHVAKLLYST